MVFVRDALETTTPQALRLYLLDVHYRRRFDHHETRLARARVRAVALSTALGRGGIGPLGRDAASRAVMRALEDDLDAPRAIRTLEREARRPRRSRRCASSRAGSSASPDELARPGASRRTAVLVLTRVGVP
jgi:cysteinyl-tRNA synthetase